MSLTMTEKRHQTTLWVFGGVQTIFLTRNGKQYHGLRTGFKFKNISSEVNCDIFPEVPPSRLVFDAKVGLIMPKDADMQNPWPSDHLTLPTCSP